MEKNMHMGRELDLDSEIPLFFRVMFLITHSLTLKVCRQCKTITNRKIAHQNQYISAGGTTYNRLIKPGF